MIPYPAPYAGPRLLRPRLWWFLLTFVSGFVFAMWAEEMAIRWRDDEIHISAPKLHFLNGRSLDHLKNGAAVPFDFQLTLWLESRSNPAARALERFVVSYDLWEEKYSVTRLRGSLSQREGTSVSHLSASAAETWCIEHIALPAPGLAADRPFHVRLEVRGVEPRQSAGVAGESGISLSRLIEVFSHPARPEQQRWTIESGPWKLDELRRITHGT